MPTDQEIQAEILEQLRKAAYHGKEADLPLFWLDHFNAHNMAIVANFKMELVPTAADVHDLDRLMMLRFGMSDNAYWNIGRVWNKKMCGTKPPSRCIAVDNPMIHIEHGHLVRVAPGHVDGNFFVNVAGTKLDPLRQLYRREINYLNIPHRDRNGAIQKFTFMLRKPTEAIDVKW